MAEEYQDEGLKGNEKIEEAIAALQKRQHRSSLPIRLP